MCPSLWKPRSHVSNSLAGFEWTMADHHDARSIRKDAAECGRSYAESRISPAGITSVTFEFGVHAGNSMHSSVTWGRHVSMAACVVGYTLACVHASATEPGVAAARQEFLEAAR